MSEASNKPERVVSFAEAIWGALLGGWFFQFLVAGTPFQAVEPFVTMFFLCLFLYLWSSSSKDTDQRTGRKIWRAILEALAYVWGAAGLASFLVWFWLIDLKQVAIENMTKAVDTHRFIFWAVVGIVTLLGGIAGFNRIRFALNGKKQQPESAP